MIPFKFLCKKSYGRTIFYPSNDQSVALLKIFKRTAITGVSSMGLLKTIVPVEIEYEQVKWEKE